MKIAHENINSLNGILRITIEQPDYQKKVDEKIREFRKKAIIPGFRKGFVPLGFIKKQYGKSIIAEEVNEIMQKEVTNYIIEKKLDIFGLPLPKSDSEIDWNANEFEFEFELGLAPTFEPTLNETKEYTKYLIQLDEKKLDDYISNLRTQFGTFERSEDIKESNNIFVYYYIKEQNSDKNFEEKDYEKKATLKMDDLLEGEAKERILNSKIGDTVNVSSNGFMKEDEKLSQYFHLDAEKIKEAPVTIKLKINDYWNLTSAETNQEFFDKVGGEKKINNIVELKTFISERFTGNYEPQTRQLFLNEVLEDLIQDTQFDLPTEFLTKWIARSNEKINSDEEAKLEYERSEKKIRHQIIESQLINLFSIEILEGEIRENAKNHVRQITANYGLSKMTDKELDSFTESILKQNKDVDRFKKEILNKKLCCKLLEKMNATEKRITEKEFSKIVEKKKQIRKINPKLSRLE